MAPTASGGTAERVKSAREDPAYPHELSGGMRQRLAIALAIALEPLLIADEPTTSLDVAVAGQVMAELSGLCKGLGSALLLIPHDLAMAARCVSGWRCSTGDARWTMAPVISCSARRDRMSVSALSPQRGPERGTLSPAPRSGDGSAG